MLLETQIVNFLHQLRDDEHLNYALTLITDIKVDVTSIPSLVPSWNGFETITHQEDLIFQLSKASPETRSISEDDKLRDSTFKEAKRLLHYYSYSPDAARKAAADALLFVVRSYKVSDKRNLFGETVYLRNFINDMKKPANAAHVALIPGLGEMLIDLEAANGRVDSLYNQRLHTLEELETMGKRVDIRKDVDAALINLLSSINTVYHYNDLMAKDQTIKTTLEHVAMRIKGLTDKLSLIIAQRKGRNKKDSEGENKPGDKPGNKPDNKPGDKPQNPIDPPTPGGPDAPTDQQNPNITLPTAPDTEDQNPSDQPHHLDPNEHPSMGERIIVKVDVNPNKPEDQPKK
ncbi:MAG: DUF6261 family protein [Tannerellaceae bacterium]|jgi:hypothetical protein|nr:DUF6261 family protein [Tannerellaceae bacterium]